MMFVLFSQYESLVLVLTIDSKEGLIITSSAHLCVWLALRVDEGVDPERSSETQAVNLCHHPLGVRKLVRIKLCITITTLPVVINLKMAMIEPIADNVPEKLPFTSQCFMLDRKGHLAKLIMTDSLMWTLYWAQVDQTGKVNILSSGMERLSGRDHAFPAMYWNMSLALSFAHSS